MVLASKCEYTDKNSLIDSDSFHIHDLHYNKSKRTFEPLNTKTGLCLDYCRLVIKLFLRITYMFICESYTEVRTSRIYLNIGI